MGFHKSDENPLFLIINFDHKPVRVSFEIENNSAFFQNTGCGISFSDIGRRFPLQNIDLLSGNGRISLLTFNTLVILRINYFESISFILIKPFFSNLLLSHSSQWNNNKYLQGDYSR